jgi:hypothetical protein
MRQLHTTSLQLEEFLGEVPCYTILLYTWEANKVTCQDIQNGLAKEKEHSCDKIRNSSLSAVKAGPGRWIINRLSIISRLYGRLIELALSLSRLHSCQAKCLAKEDRETKPK